jgi:hypothetical protein
MFIKCAECQCVPEECIINSDSQRCQNCTKETCCCLVIHHSFTAARNLSIVEDDDYCCSNGVCKNNSDNASAELRTKSNGSIPEFFRNVKSLYAAALGIEILCITAAEIGENTGLYVLGFNHIGILFAYAMGYSLATFTTFVTILGRYRYSSGDRIHSCCSVLEQQDTNKDFLSNVVMTFKNFGSGLRKMKEIPKQPNLREMLKTSLIILVTAETACIITAETIDLIFYKQAFYLSIPLALFAGAFTVAAPEAYKKMRLGRKEMA